MSARIVVFLASRSQEVRMVSCWMRLLVMPELGHRGIFFLLVRVPAIADEMFQGFNSLYLLLLFIISTLSERRTHGQLNLTAQNPGCVSENAIKNKDKFDWLWGSYFLGAIKTTTCMQRERMYAQLHENYIEYTAKNICVTAFQ